MFFLADVPVLNPTLRCPRFNWRIVLYGLPVHGSEHGETMRLNCLLEFLLTVLVWLIHFPIVIWNGLKPTIAVLLDPDNCGVRSAPSYSRCMLDRNLQIVHWYGCSMSLSRYSSLLQSLTYATFARNQLQGTCFSLSVVMITSSHSCSWSWSSFHF